MVVQHASSLRTKLNAYSLQCFILLSACSPKEMDVLLNTIVATLEALGEKLPGDVSPTDISSQIRSAQLKVGKESDNNMFLLNKVSTESQTNIMQAYNILTSLAYVARPKLYPYFAARWVQYTLEHKVSSKYTPGNVNRHQKPSLYFLICAHFSFYLSRFVTMPLPSFVCYICSGSLPGYE